MLTTDGPALSAQLLDEARDAAIGEPFSIGAQSTLALPAGDYRLRVQAPGLMGQTYRLAFNRGETGTRHLALSDDRLLAGENIPIGRVVAVELTTGKADLVEWTGDTLIRRDGSTGKPIWDTAHPPRLPVEAAGRDPVDRLRTVSKISDQALPGAIVLPAPGFEWRRNGRPRLADSRPALVSRIVGQGRLASLDRRGKRRARLATVG